MTKQLPVEYIDPEKRPTLADKLKENAIGTVVLEYEGRVQRVTSDAEQELTNGLDQGRPGQAAEGLLRPGHGERDLSGSDGAGYSGIVEAAEGDNFVDRTAGPRCSRTIPADASVVMVAGPKSDLLRRRSTSSRRFLAKGGKLLILIDPPDKPEAPPLTNLIAPAQGLVG